MCVQGGGRFPALPGVDWTTVAKGLALLVHYIALWGLPQWLLQLSQSVSTVHSGLGTLAEQVRTEGGKRSRNKCRGARQRERGGAEPYPHDAHIVHARQSLIALLRAVDLLPQLLRRPDVVPPSRVHPLEGQPTGLRAEARAGAGVRGQDPA